MIDTPTAWSILCGSLAGTTMFATVGWIYNSMWRRCWAKEAEESLELARQALDQRDTWRRLASDLQEQIDIEAAKRSSITSRGNLTKAAKRKAAIAATTTKLRSELQAAQPAERLAA